MKAIRYIFVGAFFSAVALLSTVTSAETKFHFDAGSKAQKHTQKKYQKKYKKHYNSHYHRHGTRYWNDLYYHSGYYNHNHRSHHRGISISYSGSLNSRRTLSLASFAFVVGGMDYFFDDGHYYRHHHGSYHRVHAPIGARIHHLPQGYSRVTIGHSHFYTYRDVYYTWDRNNRFYTVVSNPYHSHHTHSHNRDSHHYSHSHAPAEHQGSSHQGNGHHNDRRDESNDRHSHSGESHNSSKPSSAVVKEQEKRYDCHLWASKETSYDPTKDPYSVYKSKKYTNAINACLNRNGLAIR